MWPKEVRGQSRILWPMELSVLVFRQSSVKDHLTQIYQSYFPSSAFCLVWKKKGAHPQRKWNPKQFTYKLHLPMVKMDKPLSIHLFWKMYVVFILIFFTTRVCLCHCCNSLGATVRWGHDNQSEVTSEALK